MSIDTALPRNQWYVAAFADEVTVGALFARTICNQPLVLFRTRSGAVTALADRCCHRRFPLSKSQLVDDLVVCGYHGFTYDSTGTCVAVPAQTRIPRTARVPRFDVVEVDGFVWLWIGDARSDPTAVPRAPWLHRKDWATVHGMEPLAARHGLLMDNLMDLSHETYLHGGYIGTPEVAATPITTEVDESAGVVRVSRHMADAECPPLYADATGLRGRISRRQDIEFQPPCLYALHSRVAPVGHEPDADYRAGRDAEQDPGAFHTEIVYALTPETDHSTHDFWAVARDYAVADDEVSRYVAENQRTVVLQDVVALNTLEHNIRQEEALGGIYRELSVNLDTGGLAARRLFAGLVAEAPAAVAHA